MTVDRNADGAATELGWLGKLPKPKLTLLLPGPPRAGA